MKKYYTQEQVDRMLDEQASRTTAEMLEKFKGYKSREEVENLIYSAMKDRCHTTVDEFKKWIEENL